MMQLQSRIEKRKVVFSLIIIILIGFMAYSNSLNGEFIWDDDGLIKNNTYIKSWSHLPRIFTESIWLGVKSQGPFYRPLQLITFMVDYSIWELDVRGYHLTNIALHILVALSIYWLVNILFGDSLLSLLTSVLFLVHPIHTEAVAYISGRADPLAALFMLLCSILYIKKLSSQNRALSLLMLGSYICALLSKEISLILPVLLLLYHSIFKKKLMARAFFSLTGIAFIYIVLRFTVLKSAVSSIVTSANLFQRIPGFFVAICNYTRLLFLPVDLHMEYGHAVFSMIDHRVIMGMLFLLFLLLYAYRKRKSDAQISFSIAWFFIALLPVSNLYPINVYMAEHWLYLPSIGFFIIIAALLCRMYRAKSFRIITTIVAVSLLTFYAFLTMKQSFYWSTPIVFYERTLHYVSHSPRLYNNLGSLYVDSGRKEEARALFKKAIEIDPDYVNAYANLALLYSGEGNKEYAIELYEKALAIKSDYAEIYNNLGLLYGDIGKKEEAIALLQKAIDIKPQYAEAYCNLGLLFATSGKAEEAIIQCKKAIELDPSFAEAYFVLCKLYYGEGQYVIAVAYCDKAIERGHTVSPAFLEALKPYRK
ncbi:tetratricopeptide repeat protein [Candidatus Omnitrophota bacterium]